MAAIQQALAERGASRGITTLPVNQENRAQSQSPKLKHERAKFLNSADTGNASVHGQETLSKEFEFSEEITAQQTQFLEQHLRRLSELQRDNPEIFNQPDFRLGQKLLASLTSAEKQSDESVTLDSNGNPIMQPDAKKIKDFLNTSEGRIVAMQAMEEAVAMESFGLTVHLAMLPPGEREQMIQEMVGRNAIRLGKDQGILDRAGGAVLGWLNDRVTKVAGRTDVAIPGFMQNLRRWQAMLMIGGSSEATAAGAAILAQNANLTPELTAAAAVGAGVASAAAIGVNYLFRTGVTLELRQCDAAFNIIKQNPVKAAYLRAMTGIDVSDWEIDPTTNQIRRAQIISGAGVDRERIPTTLNISESRRSILEKFATRQQFYKEVGVKDQDLDATPEQFLYRYFNYQQEQANTTWTRRIQERFKPRTDGIRDTAQRRESNPNFDPNQPDTTGNLKRFMKARQMVTVDMMDEYIRTQLKRESSGISIGSMQKKYEGLAADGEGRRARKAEPTARRDRLNTDQTTLDGERTSLETYNTSVATLQTARENLQREIDGITIGAPPIPLPPGISIEGVIKQINLVKMNPAAVPPAVVGSTTVTIAGRDIPNLFVRKTDYDTRLSAALAAITAPGGLTRGIAESDDSWRAREKQASDVITKQFKEEYELTIRPDEDFLKGYLGTDADNPGRLRELQAEIRNKETVLANGGTEGTAAAEVVNNLSREFDYLTNAPPAGTGIPEANLRPPRSLDQIMRDINTANAANPALGWPETQNNRPEIRMRVLHGIIEARARNAETLVETPGPAFTNITTVWNISENDLRVLSENAIIGRVSNEMARRGIGGAAPVAAIQEAMRVANIRFSTRLRSLTEQNNEVTELSRQEQLILNNVDAECERDREELKMIMEQLKDKRGKTMEMANIVLEGQQPNRYTESRVLTVADRGYQEAERAAGQPRGYHELMKLIFDYQNNPSRAQAFETVQRILPPDELARILNNTLRLNLPAAGLNLTNALDLIAGRLVAGVPRRRVSVGNLGDAFNDIFNAIIERGLAVQ